MDGPACASLACEGGQCVRAPLTWGSDVSPWSAFPGQVVEATCPPEGSPGAVWGTDVFTSDSSVCTAAVHSGLITLMAGGNVTFEVRGPRTGFGGTTRNGITTRDWPSYPSSFAFVPAGPCANGMRDRMETDVDCGGPECGRCALGGTCGQDTDCTTETCAAGVCSQNPCTNTVKDGQETDVDCGGAVCAARCAVGQQCGVPEDCASGRCTGGLCEAPPCSNGVKDGEETDEDCGGGGLCERCDEGQVCVAPEDCLSARCVAGVCEPPLCQNQRQDPGETDVDCGGTLCGPCALGLGCTLNADCRSGRCAAGVCAPASCSNSATDGLETDVDCGGFACVPCAVGRACSVMTDCESRNCEAGVCGPVPACLNGQQDGTESDVDCGGACGPCGGGDACVVAGDCLGDACTGLMCAAPAGASFQAGSQRMRPGHAFVVHCDAMSIGGGLWGTDYYTDDSSVCLAARHSGVLGATDGGDVTVVVAPGRPAYLGAMRNGVSSNSYGTWAGSFRFEPPGPCANGVQDAEEADVDCGGGCAPCATGARCGADPDCVSNACGGGHCG